MKPLPSAVATLGCLAVLRSVAPTQQQLVKQTPQRFAVPHPWVHISIPLDFASSFVLGPTDGVPRVAGLQGGDVHYAALNMQTGVWSNELVAAGPAGGPSIAVDAALNPHVSFNGSGSFGQWGELMYATRTTTGWTAEVVDASVNYGYDTSIAVDTSGGLHILGKQEPDGVLWYWTKVAGAWTGEVVDADGNPGRYSDLVVDAGGTPHAVYSTWSPNADPRYAVRTAGAWSITTLDFATATYRSMSIDLDSQGHPHVIYHDDNDRLYYTHFDGTSWSPPELIFTGGGKYASLGVDRFDVVHVAVHTSSLPSLTYWMTRATNGVWSEPLFVDQGTVAGLGDALDTDVFGRPWLIVQDSVAGPTLFTR